MYHVMHTIATSAPESVVVSDERTFPALHGDRTRLTTLVLAPPHWVFVCVTRY